MPTLRQKLVFSLVPVTALVVIGLAAGELWARAQVGTFNPSALAPSPLGPDRPESEAACYEPHVTRGWAGKARTCGRNDLGLYVYGTAGGVPETPEHVLFLGDSIADQQRWVRRAADVVQASAPDVVTFNGGVPGYDTCHELQVYEEVGRALDPSMVIVEFCLNDYQVTPVVVPAPDGKVRVHLDDGMLELPRVVLRSRLATWLAVSRQWGRIPGRAPPMPGAKPWAEDCLDQLQAHAEADGFTLGVVVFPVLSSDPTRGEGLVVEGRDWRMSEVEARITGFLDDRGIEALVLRPTLEARGPLEQQRLAPHDPWHPNDTAQDAIGEAVGTWMRSLRGSPPPR